MDQRSIWALPSYTLPLTSVVGPYRQYVDQRSIWSIPSYTVSLISVVAPPRQYEDQRSIWSIPSYPFFLTSLVGPPGPNQYGDQRSIWSLPFYTTSVVGPSRQYVDLRSIMVRTILYFTFNICSWTPSSVCGPEKQAQMVSTTLSIDLWDGLLNKNK